jgi:hypothetical protein
VTTARVELTNLGIVLSDTFIGRWTFSAKLKILQLFGHDSILSILAKK